MKKKTSRVGLILLAILGIILLVLSMQISGIHFGGTAERVRHMALHYDIQGIDIQLGQYKGMNGFYPTTEQGLQALVTPPTTEPRPLHWQQLYRESPRDPWGNNYVYRCPGNKKPRAYDLFSAGPDGVPDTADDDWGESRNGLTIR